MTPDERIAALAEKHGPLGFYDKASLSLMIHHAPGHTFDWRDFHVWRGAVSERGSQGILRSMKRRGLIEVADDSTRPVRYRVVEVEG